MASILDRRGDGLNRPVWNGFQQMERKLIGEKKPMLPVHAGESRYQVALDSDRNFREMILAAFALALFAATGFGQAAITAGPIRTGLLCLAGAGFGLRIVALRFASPGTDTGLVDGPHLRLVATVVGGAGVVGSLLGGSEGIQAVMGVLLCTALLLAGTSLERLRPLLYTLVGIVLTAFITYSYGTAGGGFNSSMAVLGFTLGVAGVAVSSLSNWDQPTANQPTMMVTSFATYGWIILTSLTDLRAAWVGPVALVTCVLYGILERQITVRSAFAPIIILLVVLHLSGFVDAGANQARLIGPHLTALLLEFCLLGMAGYRHAIAALNRFPLATYRSSPQCLVPTTDHAWDHPVKIDAA